MQDLVRDFVVETVESLDALDAELLRFEAEPDNPAILAKIYRLLHTIKGTCGFLDLARLERLSHAAEGLVTEFRQGRSASRNEVTLVLLALDRVRGIVIALGETGREPDGEDHELTGLLEACARHGTSAFTLAGRDVTGEAPPPAARPDPVVARPAAQGDDSGDPDVLRRNVRVSVERLDHLMTMVSELVLVRNQLVDLARREGAGPYKLPLQRLSTITGELQDGVMRTRMQPIKGAWSKAARIARDLSGELGKDIAIDMQGGSTEIDRQILEVIKDCLVHMIRNAADHGLETPDERRAAGKPPQGVIRLKARQEGSQIVFSVEDDGRGLDRDRIAARALACGLVTEDSLARMSEQDVGRLIFSPGVSTAGQVTTVSGRGIGLDAVRSGIEQVGGLVDVISRPGAGTSLILRLPLTLAVAGVLVVEVAGQAYALPQVSIAELVRAQDSSEVRYERLGDGVALRMRNTLLPMLDLAGVLTAGATSSLASGFIVICEVGRLRFGLAVDAIHQTEEIVVKPLSPRLRHIPYYSGATILGDGSVILILEATGFADLVRPIDADEHALAAADAATAPPKAPPVPMLVYAAGSGPLHAVPMALVARLEEFDPALIHSVGGHRLIAYKGALLPLLPAAPDLVLRTSGLQPVVVFEAAGRSVGVMVDDIVDVVEADLDLDLALAAPGALGTALIDGRMMSVPDIAALLAEREDCVLSAGAERPQLLMYEPSEFFGALLVPVLEGAGLSVSRTASATEAIDLGRTGTFAVVVIDLDHSAGMALAATLRQQDGLNRRRLIGLATRRSAALMDDARLAGVDTVVGKFDRRMLIDELRLIGLDTGAAA